MPVADDLVNRVRSALAHVPDVEEKRMFGSLGFLVRGKLCIGARPDRIMCRIDPQLHNALLRRGDCRTVIMRGREYRGYLHVGAESLGTEAALRYWVDLALHYNTALTSQDGAS